MIKTRFLLCFVSLLLGFRFASAGSIFNESGTIDRTNYLLEAYGWNRDAVDSRLGPKFSDLNPLARDTRPTLFKPTSKDNPKGFSRINPWELGTKPASDGN